MRELLWQKFAVHLKKSEKTHLREQLQEQLNKIMKQKEIQ